MKGLVERVLAERAKRHARCPVCRMPIGPHAQKETIHGREYHRRCAIFNRHSL